jgi:hypothetical protein
MAHEKIFGERREVFIPRMPPVTSRFIAIYRKMEKSRGKPQSEDPSELFQPPIFRREASYESLFSLLEETDWFSSLDEEFADLDDELVPRGTLELVPHPLVEVFRSRFGVEHLPDWLSS